MLGDKTGSEDRDFYGPDDIEVPAMERGFEAPEAPEPEGGESELSLEEVARLAKRVDRRNKKLNRRLKEAQERNEALEAYVRQVAQGMAPPPQTPQVNTVYPVMGQASQPLTAQEQARVAELQRVMQEDPEKGPQASVEIGQIYAFAATRAVREESAQVMNIAREQNRAYREACRVYPEARDESSELYELAAEIYAEMDPSTRARNPQTQFLAIEAAANRLGIPPVNRRRKRGPAPAATPPHPATVMQAGGGPAPPAVPPGSRPGQLDDDTRRGLASDDEYTRKTAVRSAVRQVARDFMKELGNR